MSDEIDAPPEGRAYNLQEFRAVVRSRVRRQLALRCEDALDAIIEQHEGTIGDSYARRETVTSAAAAVLAARRACRASSLAEVA